MQLEIEEIAKKVKKLQKIKSVSMRSLTLGMRQSSTRSINTLKRGNS